MVFGRRNNPFTVVKGSSPLPQGLSPMTSPRLLRHLFTGFERCWKTFAKIFDLSFSVHTKQHEFTPFFDYRPPVPGTDVPGGLTLVRPSVAAGRQANDLATPACVYR